MKDRFHHPFHLSLEHQIYWVTSATLYHEPILNEPSKEIWRNILKEKAAQEGIRLYGWVLLDNHYHLLLWIQRPKGLPKFVQVLNGKSSHDINRAQGKEGRRVWYQYWDRFIRSEEDFYVRLNYIHHNPVKHGYVANPEDYPFSSYRYYKKKKGTDWLQDLWERYPVTDFTPEEGER